MNESDLRSLKSGDVVYHDQFAKERTVDHVEYDNGKRQWVAVSKNGSRMTSKHIRLVRRATDSCNKPCNDKQCNDVSVKGSKAMGSLTNRLDGVVCMAKNDAGDAVWRTAAKQAVRTARTPVVAFLAKSKFGMVAPLAAEFLDTEAGEAALAYVVGNVMAQVPSFSCDPKLRRLAKELRVLGLEFVSDKVADLLLSPVRDGLKELVGGLNLGVGDAAAE
jgi:hypothetical protein